MVKGIEQLTEEGAIQKFRHPDIGLESPIIGAVGMLQFEVLEYRLTHEYGVDIRIEQLPYNLARWAIGENLTQGLLKALDNLVLKDDEDNFVVLFRNEWSLNWEVNNKKQVTYLDHPPSI